MHPLPEGRQGHEGRLTTLLGGALAHLERHRVQVNELNVFPVADGDTGDNMIATLRAYAAVPEPVEGTMLTVARDMAAAGALAAAHGVEPPAEPSIAPGAALLTVLTAEDAPLSDEEIRALAPAGVEVEVTPGAPPPWWWLLAAE